MTLQPMVFSNVKTQRKMFQDSISTTNDFDQLLVTDVPSVQWIFQVLVIGGRDYITP